MSGHRGFSIIEVIIAIAVFAIISTFAIPSFVHQSNETKSAGRGQHAAGRPGECAVEGDARERERRGSVQRNGYTIFIDNGAGGGTADNWVRDG